MTNATLKRLPNQGASKHLGGLVLLVFVFLVILFSLWNVIQWMRDEEQLPLSQLVVQGNLNYLRVTQVRDAINHQGALKSFMLQDVDSIHSSILELPWVSSVSVRKQWPDTLKVNITEYKPLAIWNESKLLDVNGIIFPASPKDVQHLNLVSFSGPDGSQLNVIREWNAMNDILKQVGLEIQELALNDRRSWRVVTRNKIRIELGRGSGLERLSRFVELYDEIKRTGKGIEYVDLRYDTGAAVGWTQPAKS